jgi:Family of unknown function (DUF5681)
MTARKNKSVPYKVGYGKPPRHAQFRKGQSGNPGGRPRPPVTERAKALALQEAYRTITVKEDGRTLTLPAIQAVLRSQIGLVAKGNVQAQRAVLATIRTIENENVLAAKFAAIRAVPAQVLAAPATIERDCAEELALADHNAGGTMNYVEAAQRIRTLLRLGEDEPNPHGEKDNGEKNKTAAGATPSRTTVASGAKPGAACS